MTKDDYVSKLNGILHNITDFFQNELHRKILEIETDIESKNQYQQLLRINNSLEQYVDKNQDLFYIGFLGSYSSGKTSTINSLLGLWGSEQCRKVSNNPTDTYISLISNSSNTDKILSFSKEGAVPIRTLTNFNIDFLDKVVIMDTPGSGDPNILETIVRDSLPLCDLIIYTLNATAPFTDIDRPFLMAQQKKLSNIPILFVITRGDEFVIDHNRHLDDSNLNFHKYDNELETLIARLNETLQSNNFSKEQFILVDNKTAFNIDRLKEVIKQYISNPNNTLVQLHNHKLRYFEKEIDSIYSHFKIFAETKICKCNDLNTQVSTNVNEFTALVKSSKHRFIEIWDECHGQIGKIYDGTYSGYLERTLVELEDIREFADSEEYSRFFQEIENHLQEDADAHSRQIIENIIRNVKVVLSGYKSEIGRIDFIDFPQNLFLTESEEIDISIPECPISNNDFCRQYIACRSEYLRKRDTRVEKIIGQLKKSISNKVPVESIFKQIENCKSKSLSEMRQYYSSVKMYKVAAFSSELKQIVSDLGLAGRLDQIEQQSVDKEKYNNLLISELYGAIDKYIEQFKIEASSIFDKIQKLGIYPQTDPTISDSVTTPELTDGHVGEDTIRRTQDFINNTKNVLVRNISETFRSTKEQIAKYKCRRRKKYVIGFVVSFVAVVVIFVLIHYWGGVWHIGTVGTIVCGIISSLLATGLIAMFDKTRTLKKECINHFKEKMDLYVTEVDLMLRDFYRTIESEGNNLAKDILEVWRNRLLGLLHNLESDENSSTQWLAQFKVIIQEYNQAYSNLNANILRCMDNHASNSQKLDSITTLIKKEAIEPSFQLLTETFNQINDVQRKINALQEV